MGRAVTIAFYIICLSFSMSLLHEINTCYQYGNAVPGCPDEPGIGHPYMPFDIQPLFTYEFKGSENIFINATNSSSYQNTLQDVVEYKPAPAGLTDIFGFFTWVIAGGRFIVNAFFMPLFGFPKLIQKFWIPEFVTYPIASILFLIQVVGIYEFFSGREVFSRE